MSTPTSPIRQQWLDQWQEEILDPEQPIVDPHHHLWERPGWRYLLDELLADLSSGHKIVATVFLQCRAMHRATGPEALKPVGETEFVNGVAAMSASGGYGPTAVCAGIVGHADLRLGAAVHDVLDAHERAGGGRFRGIRHIAARDDAIPGAALPPAHLLTDPDFQAGFAALAPRNLSFDAWLYHPQIPELTALARAFPETIIILNHVGGPLGIGPYAGQRDDVFRTWAASIRDLASCPNVRVKLGGLGMPLTGLGHHEQPTPLSSAQLADAWRPYFTTCLDAFGTARAMFESNFPVDKESYIYAAYWNACKLFAQGMSADERADLFWCTATQVYRLDLPELR